LMVEERLAAAGYAHYETSAFAKPQRRSRHNLNYWQFGDYLGIGAGAHGKLSFADRVARHEQVKQPREYLSASQTAATQRQIPASELPFEFMLNALRLVEGFPKALFAERTGLPAVHIERQIQEAHRRSLLES